MLKVSALGGNISPLPSVSLFSCGDADGDGDDGGDVVSAVMLLQQMMYLMNPSSQSATTHQSLF
jgi:hypothetical protein